MSNYNPNRSYAPKPAAMSSSTRFQFDGQRPHQATSIRRAHHHMIMSAVPEDEIVDTFCRQGQMPRQLQHQPDQGSHCQRPNPPRAPAGACSPNVDAYQQEMEDLQIENLVKDSYCPGAIQDTIDCNENFNTLAFQLVFGTSPLPDTPPVVDPMSILEAFQTRIDYERCENSRHPAEQGKEFTTKFSTETLLSQIDDTFKAKYRTDLNESLACYLKAETLYNAEEPISHEPTFKAEMSKGEMELPTKPIVLKQYCGITRPI